MQIGKKSRRKDSLADMRRVVIRSGSERVVYQPHEEPAFFNITVEQRHLDHMNKKDIDEESHIAVVYQILKDNLRKAKKYCM